MNSEKDFQKIGFFSLFVIAMLVNILGQMIHEGGHSLIYQIMGRDPVWGFTKMVQIWDTSPLHPEKWTETKFEDESGWVKISSPQESKIEKAITAVAGPIAGLLGAIVGLVVFFKGRRTASRQAGLAWAIRLSFTALQYYLRSGNRIGGDEYEFALQLGISPSLPNIVFGISFAICLVLALARLPGWAAKLKWLGIVVLGSAITGVLMFLGDDVVIDQVNLGNPWFRPVLGYALPVFVINVLAIAGIALWVRQSYRKSQ
jgi:hypothetical protein